MARKVPASTSSSLLRVFLGLVLMILSFYLFWILHKGSGLHPSNLSTQLGFIGAFLYRLTHSLAGQGGWLIPLSIFAGGLHLSVPRFSPNRYQVIGAVGIALLILGWKHINIDLADSFTYAKTGIGGGLIGAVVSYVFVKLLGPTGAKLVVLLLMLLFIFIGTEGRLIPWIRQLMKNARPHAVAFVDQFKRFVFVEEDASNRKKNKGKIGANAFLDRFRKKMPNASPKISTEEKPAEAKKTAKSARTKAPMKDDSPTIFINNLKDFHQELIEEDKQQKVQKYIDKGYVAAAATGAYSPDLIYHMPSYDLLQEVTKKGLDINQAEIDEHARILEKTLDDFGVRGKISEVSVGPTITEYEFQPAPGIKVSKILNLADDLALSLATSGIRIEAPIPGKAAVGIEVPNKRARVVRIKEVLLSDAFQEAESRLTVALGKDISGKSMVTDLSKMPHMLIAGSTGSGKSVCLNALILSILYKAKPYEVKFLMIDPKMVELNNYNGIPHLLAPVVTDSRKAAGTLRWAVREMEKRYEQFAAAGVKDILRYNAKCIESQALDEVSEENQLMPHIVIIIDELADLMMVAPADVEDAICRLAQMARAAGMHLVIATQRPSVDVITGIIKANIPSRIAFSVSSQVDSRTILDMGGAEKLLGRGDMLFYPTGMAKPKRIQGVYVTDEEIEAVVDFLRKEAKPEYNEEVMNAEIATEPETSSELGGGGNGQDELLADACRLFIENGQASISMLQRHFRIGYTRAARIIDELESRGYVGPYEGSKPRQIKITLAEYDQVFGGK